MGPEQAKNNNNNNSSSKSTTFPLLPRVPALRSLSPIKLFVVTGRETCGKMQISMAKFPSLSSKLPTDAAHIFPALIEPSWTRCCPRRWPLVVVHRTLRDRRHATRRARRAAHGRQQRRSKCRCAKGLRAFRTQPVRTRIIFPQKFRSSVGP